MPNPYNNPKDIWNNNAQINKSRKDRVEKYILDINKKLCELADFLFLDIQDELNNETIQKAKASQNKTSFESVRFGDIGKRAIINEVLAQEKKENFRKEAIEAAGITMKELSKSAKDICAELKKPINSIAEAEKGTPPPKTDWKREGLSTSEKDKIIKSLRANPKSSVFSKEFQWQPEEFLEAFNYLESSAKYNGPFIISVVDNREELKKYSGIKILSKGIEEMYFGKYVLLSVYDITATESNPNESKHIHMGLKYLNMAGRLEFDCIGSTDSGISNNQRLSVKEYLDAMDILYDEDDKDLKIRI
jgi:hypothetical protein